jgi:protein-tyrosine phosphatase
MPSPEVLFICTGNYYRSRFSEAWFNHLATRDDSPWRAFSRGLHIELAPPGLSLHTRAYLQARGVELKHTTPERHPLTAPDLERAAQTIALKETEHRPSMRQQFPTWADRITYWHFHDLDVDTAEEMLPTLAHHVEAFYRSLPFPPAN